MKSKADRKKSSKRLKRHFDGAMTHDGTGRFPVKRKLLVAEEEDFWPTAEIGFTQANYDEVKRRGLWCLFSDRLGGHFALVQKWVTPGGKAKWVPVGFVDRTS